MSERYSEGEGGEAAAERIAGEAEWQLLLGRLLPGVDTGLLVRALRDEAAREVSPTSVGAIRASDLRPAERELHRVRAALALGASARMLQHSINNPLTALLAEAQLLEFEPLTAEQRASVARIVEQSRRIAAVVRRLDVGDLEAPAAR